MSPQTNMPVFHKKDRNINDLITSAIESNRISENDADLIKSYIVEKGTSGNIKNNALVQITRLLISMSSHCSGYKGATITDLYTVIDAIKTGKSQRGRSFTPATQQFYMIGIKSFFSWLVENDHAKISHKKIKEIKLPKVSKAKVNAADLLTSDEISQIVNACTNSRNRAIFLVLYEGGFRIGEVATLKWGAVKFDNAGLVINVNYKTSKSRYLRLVLSKEALAKWKSDYPGEISNDAYVFLNNRGEMLNYAAVLKILKTVLEKSELKKRVNWHLFRHTRITHLIQQGVSESVIKMMMWGSVNTEMFSVYAHLSGVDIDREISKLYGMPDTIETKKEKSLTPQICPNCQNICGPLSRYCSICGKLLDETDIKDADELKKWLMANKDLLTEFLNNNNA